MTPPGASTAERCDLAAVDAYLRELGRRLRGPRRARADLLAEARGGLVDATEEYERRGVPTAEAQRRALADFGDAAVVAPGYQAELAVAQSRRTALLILAILTAQSFLWDDDGGMARDVEHGWMLDAVKWGGGAAMLGAFLFVLGTARGVRYLGVRPALARVTAVFAFGVAAAFTAMGIALTAVHDGRSALFGLSGFPRTAVFLIVPLAVVALSARRCLLATAPLDPVDHEVWPTTRRRS